MTGCESAEKIVGKGIRRVHRLLTCDPGTFCARQGRDFKLGGLAKSGAYDLVEFDQLIVRHRDIGGDG